MLSFYTGQGSLGRITRNVRDTARFRNLTGLGHMSKAINQTYRSRNRTARKMKGNRRRVELFGVAIYCLEARKVQPLHCRQPTRIAHRNGWRGSGTHTLCTMSPSKVVCCSSAWSRGHLRDSSLEQKRCHGSDEHVNSQSDTCFASHRIQSEETSKAISIGTN
jgi:hypothetical protein